MTIFSNKPKPRIIVILSCLLFLYGCGYEKKEKYTQNLTESVIGEALPVETQIIKKQDFQKQITANGLIKAKQKTELRFKGSNRINSILVENGEKVNKRQTLAVLDNALLANQLEKAEIAFDKAKNKFNEEKIRYGLNGKKVSEINPKVLKNLYIKSGYRDAINNLENLQILYSQTFLKAPFTGVIANLKTKPGNYITSGEVFCLLINPNDLEVYFSVLESELPFIEPGQEVNITTFSNEGENYNGVVSEINPIVDENGLVKIKATLKNIKNSLLEGMHVKVFINKPIQNMVVVPKEALVLRSNREVVFTVENGLAKWNYVEVLYENSRSYAIKQGLEVGDTIIVSGNMNLSHDAKVDATFLSGENLN